MNEMKLYTAYCKIAANENEFAACRRFVRKVKHCRECLHFPECLSAGKPVALASREFAEVGRMVERINSQVYEAWLPPIKVHQIKATASCRLISCKTHKFCVAIAYNDRSYDYLKFNDKPSLNALSRAIYITINAHFGKDTTK